MKKQAIGRITCRVFSASTLLSKRWPFILRQRLFSLFCHGGWCWLGAGCAMDGIKNFLPVHRNFLGRNDTKTNLVAPNLNDSHRDVVVDDNALILSSRQDEHRIPPKKVCLSKCFLGLGIG